MVHFVLFTSYHFFLLFTFTNRFFSTPDAVIQALSVCLTDKFVPIITFVMDAVPGSIAGYIDSSIYWVVKIWACDAYIESIETTHLHIVYIRATCNHLRSQTGSFPLQ